MDVKEILQLTLFHSLFWKGSTNLAGNECYFFYCGIGEIFFIRFVQAVSDTYTQKLSDKFVLNKTKLTHQRKSLECLNFHEKGKCIVFFSLMTVFQHLICLPKIYIVVQDFFSMKLGKILNYCLKIPH